MPAAFGRKEVSSPPRADAEPLDELAALRAKFIESERQRQAQIARRSGEVSEIAINYDAREPVGPAPTASAPVMQTEGPVGHRSLGIAYALWLVLSPLAAHRFYLGASNSAYVQTGLFLVGAALLLLAPAEATAVTFIGILCLLCWGSWFFADAFATARLFKKREAGERMANAFL